MLVQVKAVPASCPTCGSSSLSGATAHIGGLEGSNLYCNSCQGWINISVPRNEGSSLTTSFASCPHCREVDAVVARGGEETCTKCGLDPNVADYPTTKLAKLWKTGSGIQIMMATGRESLNPHRSMGRFLRDECGPRCSLAENCDQDKGSLVECFQDFRGKKRDRETIRLEDFMSKRSRKRRAQQKRLQKNLDNLNKKDRKRTFFAYARGGWIEETYGDRANSEEHSGATGSGSGA